MTKSHMKGMLTKVIVALITVVRIQESCLGVLYKGARRWYIAQNAKSAGTNVFEERRSSMEGVRGGGCHRDGQDLPASCWP